MTFSRRASAYSSPGRVEAHRPVGIIVLTSGLDPTPRSPSSLPCEAGPPTSPKRTESESTSRCRDVHSGKPLFSKVRPTFESRLTRAHPISRVALIAEGEVVWDTRPDTTVWSERFFLPLHHRSYVRPLLESESGGYRTLGNPIFLIPDRLQSSGEVPYEEPDHHDTSFLEVGGTIEATARLSEAGQKRIIAEFLSADETRYPTVWLLQNRRDLVRDETLLDLTASENERVRLGATYALLCQGNTASLATMLNDPALPIRAYAARTIAQYTEGFGEDDWPIQEEEDPLVVSYLIRAYNPVRHRPGARCHRDRTAPARSHGRIFGGSR